MDQNDGDSQPSAPSAANTHSQQNSATAAHDEAASVTRQQEGVSLAHNEAESVAVQLPAHSVLADGINSPLAAAAASPRDVAITADQDGHRASFDSHLTTPALSLDAQVRQKQPSCTLREARHGCPIQCTHRAHARQ